MQQQNEVEVKNEIKSRIRGLFVGSVEDFNKLNAALQSMSESELRDAALKLQTAAANRAETYLREINAGLKYSQENRTKIDERLGPYHTLKQFRDLVLSDKAFKESLQWDAEPFGEVLREEHQQALETTASERKRRREFSAVVNNLTANGVANIADNEANFHLSVEQLDDLLVAGTVQGTFIAALTQAFVKNLIDGLSKNQHEQQSELVGRSRQQLVERYQWHFDGGPESQQIRKWIADQSIPVAEIRERLELADQLADSVGGTVNPNELQFIRGRRFRSLVLSPTTPVESMRQQVAAMNERADLRQMSREELKALAHKEYEEHRANWKGQIETLHKLPLVPPEITAQAIRDADAKTQREWHQKYGLKAIDARLQGVA
jgi:hypothetical protein